jgi:hypothetical protein
MRSYNERIGKEIWNSIEKDGLYSKEISAKTNHYSEINYNCRAVGNLGSRDGQKDGIMEISKEDVTE